MEVQLSAELQARLDRWSLQTGRPAAELVQDVVTEYLDEAVQVHDLLDARYGDLKSGRAEPIDGEAFFEGLRLREEEILRERR